MQIHVSAPPPLLVACGRRRAARARSFLATFSELKGERCLSRWRSRRARRCERVFLLPSEPITGGTSLDEARNDAMQALLLPPFPATFSRRGGAARLFSAEIYRAAFFVFSLSCPFRSHAVWKSCSSFTRWRGCGRPVAVLPPPLTSLAQPSCTLTGLLFFFAPCACSTENQSGGSLPPLLLFPHRARPGAGSPTACLPFPDLYAEIDPGAQPFFSPSPASSYVGTKT